MIKQKYIGIENELKSFYNNMPASFSTNYFRKLINGKNFRWNDSSQYMRGDKGNYFYIDGDEIEIVTPPIAINKGFASRLTDSLIIGRNHVIRNTPELQHTGYSMHWNVTRNSRSDNDKIIAYNNVEFYRDIAIPFQLFGLTPMSCGFNVKSKYGNRFEIAGDSLTNRNQINATALLLGAYAVAKFKNNFPLIVKKVELKETCADMQTQIPHMLRNGRYTVLSIAEKSHPNKFRESQAQNVLELFYEWLSPFIYKLGDRYEISNLEAFIKGDNKLEIDDFKYFYMLRDLNGYSKGTYAPIPITTAKGFRSPELHTYMNPKLPLEGKLLQSTVDNTKVDIRDIEWNELVFRNDLKAIVGIRNVYKFLEEFSQIKYRGTSNLSKVHANNIKTQLLHAKLDSRIIYDSQADNSAVIANEEDYLEYIRGKKKHISLRDLTTK